jgi:hypothetical protein
VKTNPTLQTFINLKNDGQAAWYMAHVLMAALTNSPAVLARSAVPGVVGKRPVAGYAGFTATAPVTAVANTTGKLAGEVFPGRPAVAAIPASGGYAALAAIPAIAPSPAYEPGTAIPAYPTVAARPAVVEVLPVAAITAVTAPAVAALKGWEDAIEITQSATELIIDATLPIATSVGIVGSSKVAIGEITPANLQATAWLDTVITANHVSESIASPVIGESLESAFYRHANLCPKVVTDTIRVVNGVSLPCKRIVVTLVPDAGFDPNSDSLQLDLVKATL